MDPGCLPDGFVLEPTLEDLLSSLDLVTARFRSLLVELRGERGRFPDLFGKIDSRLHGIDHWIRVALHGLAIAAGFRARRAVGTPSLAPAGALEEAVVLAAFFHDCARRTEGSERDHGPQGERVLRRYREMKALPADLGATISQAVLFHVAHAPVDPAAGEVAIALCNADRIDRVRLGEEPDPARMYPEPLWRSLARLAPALLSAPEIERARFDHLVAFGIVPPPGPPGEA
jgi:hypothetical protein